MAGEGGASPALFICIPINVHVSQLFISLDLVPAQPRAGFLAPLVFHLLPQPGAQEAPGPLVSLGCYVPHLWPGGRGGPNQW